MAALVPVDLAAEAAAQVALLETERPAALEQPRQHTCQAAAAVADQMAVRQQSVAAHRQHQMMVETVVTVLMAPVAAIIMALAGIHG